MLHLRGTLQGPPGQPARAAQGVIVQIGGEKEMPRTSRGIAYSKQSLATAIRVDRLDAEGESESRHRAAEWPKEASLLSPEDE